MTTFYPNQPTPSFMKKYTRTVYNRVHHNQHHHPVNGFSDEASLQLQPYRTTPLVLPSAKSNLQKNLPTESYLRHHPNPQMRGPPTHDFSDILMKQKVADSVLHRVVGDNHAHNGPKVVHKQFNSPIGLYSDNLIENTIKNTVSPVSQFSPQQSNMSASSSSVPSPNGTLNRPQHRPTKIEGYKKTVVYDPTKSATFQALQESNYNGLPSQEVAAPVQPRVFQPNRLVPAKKPVYHTQESFPPPDPMSRHNINSLGEANDVIHQSGSFKRLMYHVLGESEY